MGSKHPSGQERAREIAEADLDYVLRWLVQSDAPQNIIALQKRGLSALASEHQQREELVEAAVSLADYWPSQNVEEHYAGPMQRFLHAVRALERDA